MLFRSTQLFVEKKIHEIQDDSKQVPLRPLSRAEDLMDKRKKNRGLTPTKRFE